ncbi:MAG: PBP1A family penicillin-binding protein [Verrucomicrobiota bacterium]|nr:PBP1A family penicillin-binding protein [Verrucomicrobiota bacterium]
MPVSFLPPTPLYHDRRRWYKQPQFYVPALVVLLAGAGALIYFAIIAAQLKAEAETFDLNQMESMESASVILDRDNKIFGQIYVENRETIPYDQIPRDLVNAVVAIEDNKFYQHGGYDLFGIVRAALKNFAAGHVRQGASTVTQQLARNSFSLHERTFRRKLLEIFLSKRIEENFGKQKIMELYLNRIYFGGGLYGAEAAARGYFGKSAKEMTLPECAMLAGLIKSPNRLSPWTDKDAAREARNVVLGRMRDLEFISAEQAAHAQSEDVVIGNRQNAKGQNYAVDYIRQKVIDAVGWDRAMNEGYRIHTTIDAELQKAAEAALRARLEKVELQQGYNHQTYAEYAGNFKRARAAAGSKAPPAPEYLQGAVIALNNATGGIVALVGGRDFEHNQYDRALQARRPAGTAMTPFVYAAAFEKGLFPGSIVEDSPLDNRVVMIGGTTGILGEWGPESADNRYEGPITAREALAKSKNGATVRVGMTPGVDNVLQLCKAAGIKSPLRPYPATFLGSSEITLAELALAYTIFPNGGWRPETYHILDRIEDKDGNTVWDAKIDSRPHKVIKPETAYEVHSCLVDALEKGTGKEARTEFGLKKMDAAGKTGTAYDFTDVLFAGYDSAITCVVWAGFDKPQKIYRGAFGHDIALPVWVSAMNASVGDFPPQEISVPKGLEKVNICDKSGMLATDKCVDAQGRPTTYFEYATLAQKPTKPCSVHGDGHGLLVRDLPAGEWPRAALAADTSAVKTIVPKGEVLLAERDPYNSVRANIKAPEPEESPSPSPDSEQMPDPSKPIMRAQAVHPQGVRHGAVTLDGSDFGTPDSAPAFDPSKPVVRARPVRHDAVSFDGSILDLPTPTPVETGTPIEIRRAIPVHPIPTETPVRRAEPVGN